jgi:hypothetical protein
VTFIWQKQRSGSVRFLHESWTWIRISVLFIFQQLWTRHYIIGENFHNPSSHKGSFFSPHFHQFLMGTVLVTYCALKKRIGLHLHFQLQKTERRYHSYLNFILDFLNIKIWHFLQKSLHCCHTLLKILKSGQPWTVIVRDGHGGGWSRKINARYLHTLMVYL